VAKRPKFSRWRRLPGVFRTGDRREPEKTDQVDRIILYVPPRILDLAEKLAEKAGLTSIQDYCALLLMQALENERIQQKVADFEARRGPLEGFKQIANDLDYLAEWKQQSETKPEQPVIYDADEAKRAAASHQAGGPVTVDIVYPDEQDDPDDAETDEAVSRVDHEDESPEPLQLGIEPSSSAGGTVPVVPLKPTVRTMSDPPAMEVLAQHLGNGDDDRAFLPCLRRGEPVSVAKVAELIRALGQLEDENRSAEVLDRRMTHALHRLALESQVLLTDAWPGAFDDRMIAAIRTIQEGVERILSGQDIRYYPSPSSSEPSLERSH
jgi:hypothetical protein